MRKIFAVFVIVVGAVVLSCFSAFGAEYAAFGSYPQRQVSPTPEIEKALYDSRCDGEVGGEKYRRVENEDGEYCYYKYEPIYWEVIKSGGESLLVSMVILDSRVFDEQEDKYVPWGNTELKYADSVTWEDSSVRTWLNSDFYNSAFDSGERSKLASSGGDRVWLLSVSEAKELEENSLKKGGSDYALAMGLETYSGVYSHNNGDWLLKDNCSVLGSAVCTVTSSGSINETMSVLVNDEGYGIVPVISLSSLEGISIEGSQEEGNIFVYKPYGKALEISPSMKDSYLNEGWYESLEEAKTHLGETVNENFAALGNYDTYKSYVTSYAKENNAKIDIECSDFNLEAMDIVRFLYPLVNEAATGKSEDYMEISAKFYYNSSFADSYEEFKKFSSKALDVIQTCWSDWGGIVYTGNSSVGTSYYSNLIDTSSGSGYVIDVRLEINRDVNDYENKLNEIAAAAKAYSSRTLGQIQYLRGYFAENVVYNVSIFSNSPSAVLLGGEGVCGSYANAVKDICFMLDIPCFVVSNTDLDHAWNCLFIEGGWYELDLTGITDPSYEVNGEYREYSDGGFNDSYATADNVSFLDHNLIVLKPYGTNEGDDISAADFEALKYLFQNGFTAADFKNRFTISEAAANSSIEVVVNGLTVLANNQSVIENGRILVPMRRIFEYLGAEVSWNGETKEITATRDDTLISLKIGSTTMYVNNAKISLDAAPRIEDGDTLVPVRAVSEALNAEVKWDSYSRRVIINAE